MAKKPILEIPSFLKTPQAMRELKRPGPPRPSFMIKRGRPITTGLPKFLRKSDAKGYTNPPRKADTSTV
tara:strand:+ start:95 stop:301 length:207 start_codon:yes stop_codon:yes gene_type:complete